MIDIVGINALTIGEAHDRILKRFLMEWKIEDESEIVTEDGENTIEIPGMKVHVVEPWREPKVSPALQFGPQALDQYVDQLTHITPRTGTIRDFEYTYANRLMDYPIWLSEENSYEGDGDGNGIHQIAFSIVKRLAENHTSRRAIAVTWVVQKDMHSREPPCLQFIQCLIRDKKLDLHAVFRSHDMAGGWGPNVFALEALQRIIARSINEYPETVKQGGIIEQGYIETYSVSAHIYTAHDQVKRFREQLRI